MQNNRRTLGRTGSHLSQTGTDGSDSNMTDVHALTRTHTRTRTHTHTHPLPQTVEHIHSSKPLLCILITLDTHTLTNTQVHAPEHTQAQRHMRPPTHPCRHSHMPAMKTYPTTRNRWGRKTDTQLTKQVDGLCMGLCWCCVGVGVGCVCVCRQLFRSK